MIKKILKNFKLTAILMGIVVQAWGQELQPVKDSIVNVPVDSVTKTTPKSSLLDNIQKLLDKQSSEATYIGTLKLKEYAIEFSYNFPIENAYQLTAIKKEIDAYNKQGKKAGHHKVYVPKTIISKRRMFAGWKKHNKEYVSKTVCAKKDTLYKEGDQVEVKIAYIDSVRVAVSEGVIELIRVYADGKSYYNTSSPIPILTIESRFNDKLFNSYDGSFILLKDAIYFEAGSRFNYFPDGDAFTIKNTKDSMGNIKLGSKNLTADNNLNTLVNFQAYTDLLGVFGNEPNGLIQFEANTKFYLHRANYRNTYIFGPVML